MHKLLIIILLLASLSGMATSNAKESVGLSDKELVATAISDNEKANKKEELEKKSADKPNSKVGESVKQKLASIDVTGVDSELKKNIELHMPVSIPTCKADRGEVRQFFSTVKKNLRKASRALGYYDAEFRSGGSIVNGCWKLRLKITQGQPTKITSQNIKVVGEGKNDELFRNILKEPPYQKGDIFNHQKYTDFKTQLSEATQALGYFDAEFKQHSVAVNPLAHQAMINLVLDTGKRYRYGKVTVEQKVLKDSVMQNFLIIKSGKFYKTEDLIKQQQLLQRSGYYQLIKVEVLRDQVSTYQVPVHITLTSKKRNGIKYKVGFGSDTGVRVSAELNRRWTGSKGKQLKAKIQAAQNLSGISLQLTSPRKNPEDDILVYNFDWTQDKNDDIKSQSINLGGKYTRKLSSDWIQTASIELLLDETQVDGESPNKSNLLLFGVGLDKTKANNLLYPSDGWRFSFGLKGALKGVISDQSVLQFNASAKRIKNLGDGRLLGRVKLGLTKADDFDSLPKSLRFFAGGGTSVRGYGFETLGDTNTDNQVIGGKHLLELSLEYQHPITDEWSAAVFVDAGNAFSDFKDFKLKVGAGFGARWRSPIGPVRVDLGFPKGDVKEPHLYLSVGSDL